MILCNFRSYLGILLSSLLRIKSRKTPWEFRPRGRAASLAFTFDEVCEERAIVLQHSKSFG